MATAGASYEGRMSLLLRWRRIGNVFCFLLAAYGLVIVSRDPGLNHDRHGLLVGSLFAFVVAAQAAMAILSLLLRK